MRLGDRDRPDDRDGREQRRSARHSKREAYECDVSHGEAAIGPPVKPGAANAYGLVGFDNNLPAPGKRPLSSMTPTIVLKDGKPVLITGSPGGSRIISAVLQVIVNSIDFAMPIDRAVSAPRLHHQWQPDKVFVEPGIAPAVLAALAARGHVIEPTEPHTSANSIAVTASGYIGAADTRTRGALAAGY